MPPSPGLITNAFSGHAMINADTTTLRDGNAHHFRRLQTSRPPVDPFVAAADARREAAQCRDEAHRLALRSQAQRDKAALLDRIAFQLEEAAVPAPIAELKSIVAGMAARTDEMLGTIKTAQAQLRGATA